MERIDSPILPGLKIQAFALSKSASTGVLYFCEWKNRLITYQSFTGLLTLRIILLTFIYILLKYL